MKDFLAAWKAGGESPEMRWYMRWFGHPAQIILAAIALCVIIEALR